jgi:hypothetical protein
MIIIKIIFFTTPLGCLEQFMKNTNAILFLSAALSFSNVFAVMSKNLHEESELKKVAKISHHKNKKHHKRNNRKIASLERAPAMVESFESQFAALNAAKSDLPPCKKGEEPNPEKDVKSEIKDLKEAIARLEEDKKDKKDKPKIANDNSQKAEFELNPAYATLLQTLLEAQEKRMNLFQERMFSQMNSLYNRMNDHENNRLLNYYDPYGLNSREQQNPYRIVRTEYLFDNYNSQIGMSAGGERNVQMQRAPSSQMSLDNGEFDKIKNLSTPGFDFRQSDYVLPQPNLPQLERKEIR